MATTTKTTDPDNEPERPPREPEQELLVDLDDEPVRIPVRYKGRTYTVKAPGDFGVLDQQRLTRDGREFWELWNSEKELTKQEGVKLDLLLNRMFHKVLDAPKEVRDALTDAHKARVVVAFTYAPLAQMQAAQEKRQVQEARDGDPTTGS